MPHHIVAARGGRPGRLVASVHTYLPRQTTTVMVTTPTTLITSSTLQSFTTATLSASSIAVELAPQPLTAATPSTSSIALVALFTSTILLAIFHLWLFWILVNHIYYFIKYNYEDLKDDSACNQGECVQRRSKRGTQRGNQQQSQGHLQGLFSAQHGIAQCETIGGRENETCECGACGCDDCICGLSRKEKKHKMATFNNEVDVIGSNSFEGLVISSCDGDECNYGTTSTDQTSKKEKKEKQAKDKKVKQDKKSQKNGDLEAGAFSACENDECGYGTSDAETTKKGKKAKKDKKDKKDKKSKKTATKEDGMTKSEAAGRKAVTKTTGFAKGVVEGGRSMWGKDGASSIKTLDILSDASKSGDSSGSSDCEEVIIWTGNERKVW